MLRSLYSGISGLKNHQVKMDVLGNNIANVNTTGFKRSRVTFSTMLNQTLKGESPAEDLANATVSFGGTNPMQIGLGAQIGSVDKIMSQGSAQSTGNNTDLMIQGKGMFVLENSGNRVYTRSGAFSQNNEGYLIDPGSGAYVMGFAFSGDELDLGTEDASEVELERVNLKPGSGYEGDDNLSLQNFAIDQKGVVTGVYVNKTDGSNETHKIFQVALSSFNNEAGLLNLDGNFFAETTSSGTPAINVSGVGSRGSMIPNAVEMSNVDLSQEFTDMIVTQRGFQANSRIITVSDTLLQELIDLKRS